MKYVRTLAAFGLLTVACLAAAQKQPIRFVELAKSTPAEVLQSFPLGAKPSSDTLHLSISLKLQDPVGLQQFVDSVSDPKDLNYRHFISPEEVGSRFGLPMTEVQKVVNYLTSQGMSIELVGKNRLTILADTTVAQAQRSFNTTIEEFATVSPETSASEVRYSFTTPISLPANFVYDVVDVGGLDSFARHHASDALTPTQLRTCYALKSTYTGGSHGEGRTIGISNWDGFRISNVATFCQTYGLPTPPAGAGTNIKVITINGGSGAYGQQGEGDLDIQTIIGMAPLANIIIYDGSAWFDPINVLTKEANDNTADMITESWGWKLESNTLKSCHNLHLSMSAQGITYMAASGDNGTSFNGYIYPNIDPEVLSVGGTSLTLNLDNTRKTEVGWNDGSHSGGGGWVVTKDAFNIHPTYQVGKGVPSAKAVPYHLFPDISLDADPNTGYFVWIGGKQYIFGGTSAASPAFAGGLSDCVQQLISQDVFPKDSYNHCRFGRIQDLLYSYNGDASVFYDVTSGTNGKLPDGTVSKATAGWDTDTGWGSMIFSGFINKYASRLAMKSISVNPTSVEGGTSTSITATVSLVAPALPGGVVVNLSSSDSSVTIPKTVTIAAGAKFGTVQVTTTTVSTAKSVVLAAATNGTSVSTILTIATPFVNSLTLNPTTVLGASSTTVTGTVKIDQTAPKGGMTVTLQSDTTSVATVPKSVTIGEGQSSATFTVTTLAVASPTALQISATAGGHTQTAALTVIPAVLSAIGLNPTSAYAGTSVQGTVTLSGVAPSNGAQVALSLSVPSLGTLSAATVTVAPGQSTASFTLTPKPVDTKTIVNVTGKLANTTITTNLTILPAAVYFASSNPTGGTGGVTNPTITVTLTSLAGPSGVKVTMGSDPTSAAKFSSTTLAIPSGQASGTITLNTVPVNIDTSVTVSATLGVTKTTTVTVLAPILTGLTVSPTSIKGGSGNVTGTVVISGLAGSLGCTVTLKSSLPSIATVPATLKIAAGKNSGTFTFAPKTVTTSTTIGISATLGTINKGATLSVTH